MFRKNGFIEYRRRELERDFNVNRERSAPQRFDPDNDYRHPHLSPEQICVRVRKIPGPDVVSFTKFLLPNIFFKTIEISR